MPFYCRHVLDHWSIRLQTAASCEPRVTSMIRTGKVTRMLVGLLVLPLALSACRHTPDEEQVRQAIAAVTHAAEAGSTSGVVKLLSDDFDGNHGELDRHTLANLVRITALRGERIGVTTGPIGIDHRGERMVATFTVTLSRRSRLLPDQVGLYQVESAWRKEGGKWRCYSASWKHVL
ncbi:MAG: hypothetical protein ABI247_11040 [Rhodanobacter sp.]